MLSEQVLDDAFAMAAALKTQIHLFTAITDDNPIDLFDQEEAYLQDLEERYQTTPPRKTAVQHHNPSEAILAYAAENDIDLIVMTPHEHSGIRRWFYKSVTKEVMDGSQCSMLILKPHA
ncbi:MAG: universal stress protein [Chloroflexi bacterium]|nr:universal stress protein [Chloroflexota bacterium]